MVNDQPAVAAPGAPVAEPFNGSLNKSSEVFVVHSERLARLYAKLRDSCQPCRSRLSFHSNHLSCEAARKVCENRPHMRPRLPRVIVLPAIEFVSGLPGDRGGIAAAMANCLTCSAAVPQVRFAPAAFHEAGAGADQLVGGVIRVDRLAPLAARIGGFEPGAKPPRLEFT